MKEIDIVKHAKTYMDMLSKRINPISKEKYNKNSDINNERLSKCFEFVSGILEKVIIEEEAKEAAENSESVESIEKNKAEKGDANAQSNKNNENTIADNSENSQEFVNTLVSEDVKGDDVVELLISKGVLKQGFSNNSELSNS